jgi:type IX secretion system PorP/SprF family membrane protein
MREWSLLLSGMAVWCFWFSANAQDLHYSQHVYNPLYYNPAFTGFTSQRARLIGNFSDRYRQGLGDQGMRTVFGSADTHFPVDGRMDNNKFLGLGAYFYNHKRGKDAVVDNVAALSFAYRMWLDNNQKHTLSAGFNFSFWNRNYNYSNLQFGNQFDGLMYNPSINSGEGASFDPMNTIDAGLGVIYAYDSKSALRAYIGASFFQLIPNSLRPEVINRSVRLNVHGGLDLSWNKISVLPSLMIDYQSDALEIYGGTLINYNISESGNSSLALIAGPYLRSYKNPAGGFQMYTINALVGLKIDNFQIMASFDNTLSSSVAVFGGFNGFELSLQYQLGSITSKSKRIYCPSWR